MTTREKAIVALAGAALVFGVVYYAFVLFVNNESAATGSTTDGIREYAADVTASLSPDKASQVHASFILARTSIPWNKDPFYEGEAPVVVDVGDSGPDTGLDLGGLSYSGFLDAGGHRIAIINGNYYEVGDTVEARGLRVKTISPTSVILQKEGADEEKIIPIEEAGF